MYRRQALAAFSLADATTHFLGGLSHTKLVSIQSLAPCTVTSDTGREGELFVGPPEVVFKTQF